MNKRKLIDVTVNPITSGIFHKLSSLDTDSQISFLHVTDDLLQSLEAQYYLNRSGGKLVSPYIERVLAINDEDTLSDNDMTLLARSIMMDSFDEWKKMLNAFLTEYSADLLQVETRVRSGTETTAHTGTDTDTREPDLETNTTRDKDKNVDETDYLHNGFNSVNPSQVDRSEEKHGEDRLVKETGKDTVTHDKDTSDELTLDTTDELSHSPNAKDATEQLIYQIQSWHNVRFLEMIFDDVDKILTSPIYL